MTLFMANMKPVSVAAILLVLAGPGIFVLAQPGGGPTAGITSKIAGPPLTEITSETGFNGILLHIALHEVHPFVIYDTSKTGNARFTGITVDLIDLLSKMLNFQYEFLIDDTSPESPEKALEAIGAGAQPGASHVADIAAGAIHITTERLEQVHFSHSYFDTGYVVVIPRPAENVDIWAFFKPFSGELWGAVVVELVIVAALFFLFEAPSMTVQEGGDSDLVEGAGWSFVDSFYWSLSALTGTLDKAPRTWAGKMLMLAHGWFFLIIVASYTANLAAFLTQSSLATSIGSWNDITAQGKMNRLAIPRGLTHGEFLGWETTHHGFQFDYVEYDRWEDAMMATLRGDAAATFHDLALVQYYIANDMQKLPTAEERCGLLSVGPTFNPVGYGFAFGLDSPAFVAFSQGVMELKEQGEIEKIVLKWGVGSKAAAAITALCPLTAATNELFFKDFHGLCIMTGAMAGAALLIWMLSKALCDKNKPADDHPAPAPPKPAPAAAAAGDSDAAMEQAVQAGVRAAMGDAGTAGSPAVQAYRQGVETGIRAGLQQLREQGVAPQGGPGGYYENGAGPMAYSVPESKNSTAWLVHPAQSAPQPYAFQPWQAGSA